MAEPERRLLEVLSWLAPEPIPLLLFEAAPLAEAIPDPREALAGLEGYSLARDDVSGDALAVVCKGSGISRTTYSTLAVLAAKDMPAEQLYERLAAFDAIPELGARRVLAHWRREQSASGARAA